MTEKAITNRLIKRLREDGYWVLKMRGSAWMHAGLPDVWAVKNGRLHCFEVKRPGQKPTRLQEIRMQELRDHGAVCYVVTDADEFNPPTPKSRP